MTQAPSIGQFCSWVIAREYYDGPMTGIGMRARDQTRIFYRIVAWDSEQWSRVFAIVPAQEARVDHLRTTLKEIEQLKEPFWLPGPATNTAQVVSAWDALMAMEIGRASCRERV